MLRFERYTYSSATFTIDDIIENRITGVVLEQCLAEQERQIFINCIKEIQSSFYKDLNAGNGFSLPGMFGQLHKTQPSEVVDDYFDNITPFCSATDNACGFAVNSWLKVRFEKYWAPYKAEVLPSLLPYSFRTVFPERGGLFVHKDGKLLPFIHDSVSKIIEQYILPETMMSWFFTIQDPQEGGELWVADSSYADYEKDGQYDMLSPDGTKLPADDLEHLKVKTPAGSLLLFKGGAYWHKVMPPANNCSNRVTLGGFMAKGREGNTIYYWS